MRALSIVLVTSLGALGCAGAVDEPGFDEASLNSASNITHLVVIVQENHSFDNYFGTWCTAPTGSNPSCTAGPGCCEAAPAREPGSGITPYTLTDFENATFDPDETQSCQVGEIDGGRMDRYVTASCGHSMNFTYGSSLVQQYRTWASQYALADRYFQPVAGASSSNDMYFATARFMFTDDTYEPQAIGHGCSTNRNTISYSSKSIGDLLNARAVTWGLYLGGYSAMVNSWICPSIPADCPTHLPSYPCYYDPSDVGQAYFKSTADDPKHFHDFTQLAADLKNGALPSVSLIRGIGYKSEHPTFGIAVSTGVSFVQGVVDQIQKSKYAASTLILLTYDESGGWYDHVAPPPTSAVDGQPYGARVPMLAIGPFARTNYVSHVTMEHSSVVKFIEWNWLGGVGQLAARDAVVNNLGSLLDPAKTGVTVPIN